MIFSLVSHNPCCKGDQQVFLQISKSVRSSVWGLFPLLIGVLLSLIPCAPAIDFSNFLTQLCLVFPKLCNVDHAEWQIKCFVASERSFFLSLFSSSSPKSRKQYQPLQKTESKYQHESFGNYSGLRKMHWRSRICWQRIGGNYSDLLVSPRTETQQ